MRCTRVMWGFALVAGTLFAQEPPPLVDELEAERLLPVAEVVDRQASPMVKALLAALRELPAKKEGKLLSGQFMGWYRAGEGAGFIASVIAAIVLLVIYGRIKQN